MSANENTDVPAEWTIDQVPPQTGKVAIVTGANCGIGYVEARELARKGAHVICACRSKERGEKAVKDIQEELKADENATGKVEFMQLDVADLDSVRKFADGFRQSFSKLDILLNNAGVMAIGYQETPQGYETQFTVNHLGHFALTAQLFDLLRKSDSARVVNVSSIMHWYARDFNEDEIMRPQSKYSPNSVYSDSKLCNLLFTLELDRRLKAAGIDNVKSVSAHPGITDSNLTGPPSENNSWHWRLLYKINVAIMQIFRLKSPTTMGAAPELYAATGENMNGGDYVGPNGFRHIRGYPAKEEPTVQAKSETAAKKLWAYSEQLASVNFKISK